ncbi:MAG: ribonuclease III [Balneolaceae bacterium]|nr:MAG: ribonuclease III [Balneolaceae bacterium]
MIERFKRWLRIESDSKNTPHSIRFKHLGDKLGIIILPEHNKIFEQALRHRSIVDNEKFDSFETYERLEFLGDAVLDLIVTEILFEKFPAENEGFLTKLRAKIVRGDTLYQMAQKLDLNTYLEIGDRAAGQGIEYSKSVLSDVYESLIAAIYVTAGYEKAFQFVQNNIETLLNLEEVVNQVDNYKSVLMEYSQSLKLKLPKYSVVSEHGPGHNKTFHVAVFIENEKMGEGSGKSKKQAEQQAAKAALEKIEEAAR